MSEIPLTLSWKHLPWNLSSSVLQIWGIYLSDFLVLLSISEWMNEWMNPYPPSQLVLPKAHVTANIYCAWTSCSAVLGTRDAKMDWYPDSGVDRTLWIDIFHTMWEIGWQRCWQHALIPRGGSGRQWGLCGGQKDRNELDEVGKDTLGPGVGVHRTSVLQEHRGVDGQPEAAGVPEGEAQGGRIWLERQLHRSRGPEAAWGVWTSACEPQGTPESAVSFR